jgi:hypothetical protein
MKTAERTFYSLCDEIDQWKAEANYWKEMYEEERAANIRASNEHLAFVEKGVGQALMFALHVKDVDGNLVIEKEDREVLANQFR